MSNLSFDDVFRAATSFEKPFEYQCRLACGPEASLQNRESLKHGTECKSQLINIPTGLGKTAAVVLASLWNRVLWVGTAVRSQCRRRLHYRRPMRTFVEEIRAKASACLVCLAFVESL
jgi:CRISPR-associated endonuclease/helicase Cas3